jgi:hypothetical protein
VITVTGEGGTATCKADDASGSFAVPRSVVDAVRAKGGGEPSGHLSLTVARQRKEIKKGKKAKGPLPNVRVIPAARLELVTTSVESAAYQGCFSGSVACGDDCVDLRSDRDHCGACGKACPGTQSCSNGARRPASSAPRTRWSAAPTDAATTGTSTSTATTTTAARSGRTAPRTPPAESSEPLTHGMSRSAHIATAALAVCAR